ncbi:MAG: S8 family peptidase [Planctomycetota bacterium]|jgi:subtilisin family serine protease
MYVRNCLIVLLFAGSAFAGDLKVIVGFKGDADSSVVKKHGARAGHEIDGIGAMTATVPAARLAKLRADPAVAYVEEDGYVSISKPGNGKGPGGGGGGGDESPSQGRPWGIDRVNGGRLTETGNGIKVAVIDTGLDLDHEDLAGNIKKSVDFTGSRKGANDEHGHGTHVGGTIAAIDNDRGVIGVAPDAYLYGVRVLDRRGWGSWSDVASGIMWAAGQNVQIANMSLGGGHSATVKIACDDAADLGVLLIAAAGNGGDGNPTTPETSYPAAYATVVSVAATNDSDGLASFSNSGPHVEVAGPGVSVESAYKNNGYATLNGTSMASPHAAGVAALIWEELAKNGAPKHTDVRAELTRRADNPNGDGRDDGYGHGIVVFPGG